MAEPERDPHIGGWGAAVVRLVLSLGPRRFRTEYAAEILDLIRTRHRNLMDDERKGWWAATGFWLRELRGVVGTVLTAWGDRMRGRDATGPESDARMKDAQAGAHPVEGTRQAVALAARSLTRSPGFTLVSILILTIGVGANTAIFSLADWALLRPVAGVTAPDELRIVRMGPAGNPASFSPISHPTVSRIREAGGPLASVAAYTFVRIDLRRSPDADPVRVRGQMVTPGFFETLGVQVRGRAFRPEEGAADATYTVAVVSSDFWAELTGSPDDPLGREFDVNGRTFRIVGVAPPGFQGVARTDDARLWVPASVAPVVMGRVPANILAMEVAPVWPLLVLRPPPDLPPSLLAERIGSAAPELVERNLTPRIEGNVSLPSGLRARAGSTIVVLGALVSVLLLLTVANLVNLFLTRVSRRAHETSVRRALGASTARLTTDLVAESVLLAGAGALAAGACAWLLLRGVDASQLVPWLPEPDQIPFDPRVFGFAFGVAVLAAVGASLAGARALQRGDASAALGSSRGVIGTRSRLRRVMVTTQVALSLVLVVGAALMVRAVQELYGSRLGYDPGGVVTFALNPGLQGYSDVEADRLFRDLSEQLRARADVRGVAFSWLAPLGAQRYNETVAPLGADGSRGVSSFANMVSPGYFDLLGIVVSEGREFGPQEYERSLRPTRGQVVLNRTLADRLFPAGDAVGREIQMEGRQELAFEVIGIVEDARLPAVDEPAGAQIFDPFGNGYRTTSATFMVRTDGDREALLASIAETIRDQYAGLPLVDAETLDERVRGALSEERAMVRVTALFAGLALLLAAAGLFGLVAEAVQSRMREFGVRTALGARRTQVLMLVFRNTLTPVFLGIPLGLGAAWWAAPLLESRLLGMPANDATAFMVAPVVLLGIAVLASLHPALRSVRTDPVEILRDE